MFTREEDKKSSPKRLNRILRYSTEKLVVLGYWLLKFVQMVSPPKLLAKQLLRQFDQMKLSENPSKNLLLRSH